MEKVNIIIDEHSYGMRVDQFLSHLLKEPRDLVKNQADTVMVNGQNVKLRYKLQVGDLVEWEYEPTLKKEVTLIGEDIPLQIIFEDTDVLVINKEAGMVVHPAKGHWSGTLSHALAHHLSLEDTENLRPGIVHRLDKDTSGLMVIAKTPKAQKGLMKAFKDRKILKIYTALVQGQLTTTYGTIDEPIGRSKKNRLLFTVDPIRGREALTEYQTIKEMKKATLLKVRIHTGRTHQIRVHFTHIGHPIIGDGLYSRWYKEPPLCLCATKLGFIHPITQEKMEFSIDLPKDFKDKIQNLQ